MTLLSHHGFCSIFHQVPVCIHGSWWLLQSFSLRKSTASQVLALLSSYPVCTPRFLGFICDLGRTNFPGALFFNNWLTHFPVDGHLHLSSLLVCCLQLKKKKPDSSRWKYKRFPLLGIAVYKWNLLFLIGKLQSLKALDAITRVSYGALFSMIFYC